ncbi:MAG: hypothetical protein DCC65_00220 [Planctomycetota bacterium]|nr:MAG: hypothetical protein DCC65_00220 [Planctomycetota bacterium]
MHGKLLRICVSGLLIVGIFDGVTARAEESVDSIQERVLALHGKIKSFSGRIESRFDSTLQGAWVKSHTQGPVAYKFQDGKILYRMDLKIETMRESDAEKSTSREEQVLMSDGDYMYQSGVQNGEKIAYKADVDSLQTCVPTKLFFGWLKRDYDLTVLPDEKVDGKDCWVIRAAKKSEEEVLQLKTVTFFRKDVPIMVKTVNYDRFDNVMQVTEIRDIKLDVELDPEKFVFKAHSDTKIIDQSTRSAESAAPNSAPAPAGSAAPTTAPAP